MKHPLLADALRMSEQLTAWRRHMHERPELSGHERETAAFIAKELRQLGYEPKENVGGTHGLTADLRVNDRPPTVALRADIDALPITEETGVPYASKNPGAMHACGHDAHASMLLGAAKLLRDRCGDLKRSVRLIFQPHEELIPGGAPDMIKGGALEGIEGIFGIHICSNLMLGHLGTRPGPFMAAVDTIHITITGVGGHAAMPNECRDPIVAAAHVVVALQTIISRSIPVSEPAVVSITKINAGTADNIIPNAVELCGTIRTFNGDVRTLARQRVKEIAESVAQAHGTTASVRIEAGYPVLTNDAAGTERALHVARELGFTDDLIETLAPQGGGEDFAYYGAAAPSTFVFLGARNEAKDCVYSHHHPRFNIDEDALPWGAALHASVALNWLDGG